MSAARLVGVAIAFAAQLAVAQVPPDLTFEARLKRLESDLRCLVCQNQTLADSNAPLAEDLRREVRSLAVAGKTDDEIRAYLVARYGDFVLYRPPVKGSTWLLWFGPFALLGLGALVWLGVVRRRRVAPEPMHDAQGAARARAMIDDPPT